MLALVAGLLLIAAPQSEDKVQLEEMSLSSSYWTNGMPLFLKIDLGVRLAGKITPSVTNTKTLISRGWQPVIRRNGQVVLSNSARLRIDEATSITYSLEGALTSASAGPVEVYMEKGVERVGPLPLQVIKPMGANLFLNRMDAPEIEKIGAVLVTNYGCMLAEFYPKKAPETVRNFFLLSSKGFYDGSKFHRIVKDFMIQGGDPKGDGTGGTGSTIKAEFNDTEHRKGVLSMAREEGKPDSASSQFFIVHGDYVSSLDRQYTAFGKLLDGYDTLDKIASVKTGLGNDGAQSKPEQPVVLKKVILVEKPGAQAGGKK